MIPIFLVLCAFKREFHADEAEEAENCQRTSAFLCFLCFLCVRTCSCGNDDRICGFGISAQQTRGTGMRQVFFRIWYETGRAPPGCFRRGSRLSVGDGVTFVGADQLPASGSTIST